jgi:hypothetical protein
LNNDYKRWREEVEVEEEKPARGKAAELEQEYKRVVWMSSVKKGRAYWKGYLSALQFAIDVLNKE